jgi:hypothetical protein
MSATLWRESLGFFLLLDPQLHHLQLELAFVGHTTGTAICAAGKGIFGSAANGAAPEARLYIVNGDSQYGLIEGTLLLMRNPSVDVLWNSTAVEQNVSEGQSVVPLVWSRIVSYYKKAIFEAADNTGPGISTVSEGANGSNVIAVGGYISKDTWWSNFGIHAPGNDYVANLSARGPGANGALKPDLLAPLGETVPYRVYEPEQHAPAGYKLAPGYYLCAGTSCAAPTAAGAAALLISAAKQSHVPYDAERLRWAMESSARFLNGIGVHEQGAGLIDIPKAWELLQRAPEPMQLTSTGTVNYAFSKYLRAPDEGLSIYEREGWTPGDTRERTITFARRSGPRRPVRCEVGWVGNDGTFTIKTTTLDLPLGTPVQFHVIVAPKSSGIHSAMLRLVDKETGLPVYHMVTTVVAAEDLNAGNDYRLELRGTVVPLLYKSWFVRVPVGTSELRMEAYGLTDGLILTALPPWGVGAEFSAQPIAHWMGGLEKPAAGVWEIVLEQKNSDGTFNTEIGTFLETRMKHQAPVSGELVVSAVRVAINAGTDSFAISNASANDIRVGFRNDMGQLKGASTRADIGCLKTTEATLTQKSDASRHEIDVVPGTTNLLVSIGRPSDTKASLDLYLYDCTKDSGCKLKKSETGGNSEEAILVRNPAPGKWVTIVAGFSLPQGQTRVDYGEVMTHPLYGNPQVVKTPDSVPTGESWKVNFTERFKALPTEPVLPAILVIVEDKQVSDFSEDFKKQYPDRQGTTGLIVLRTMTLFPLHSSTCCGRMLRRLPDGGQPGAWQSAE